MNNNYIVITTQRTGSSMFMDLLNGFDNLEGHMELFLDQNRLSPALAGNNDFPRYFEWKNNNFTRRPFSVWKYLNEFYSRKNATGFKLMYSHLRIYPEIIPYLILKKIKIIHLIRQNYLDIILSEELARISGKSHITNSDDTVKSMVTLDPATTLKRLKKLELNTSQIQKLIHILLPNDKQEIFYEDILENKKDVMNRIKVFFDIDINSDSVESNLKKRQKNSKREIIRNYDELAITLKQTPYLHFLES